MVSYVDFDLCAQIYEAILDIPIEPSIQHLVKKYLNTTQQKLREPEAVNTMYQKQCTIWIIPPAPAFIPGDFKFDVEQLLYPRVCVWVPHHLPFKKKQDSLICPTADCDGKLGSEGFTDQYTYRKIIGPADHFYILTHTYKCSKNEKHIFGGCNEKIVNQLHELSQRGYDIHHMASNYGISKTLQHVASVYKRNGMSDAAVIAAVKSLHSEKIKRLHKQYTLALNKS
ncbi:hypothetical protein INT48_008076 [Thamnidium elegans]|uniref:DUF6729 domain-containing protein n=1 Tax=Thamnidium elegans TaxID=101142 RepID=A0A8H7VWG9_9FUNG|nr:hypothetical protein INT48_008076 [Thamnidium elegans]